MDFNFIPNQQIFIKKWKFHNQKMQGKFNKYMLTYCCEEIMGEINKLCKINI